MIASAAAASTGMIAHAPSVGPAIKAGGATYFLSGVMGGSQTASSTSLGIPMESQDYRGQIRAAILAADAAANIVDPLEMGAVRGRELGFGEGKPSWTDDADVRKLFAEVVDAAAAADVVVSYLPTASMGSACELHAAHAAHKTVLCIAPGAMAQNWVVRSFSARTFEDIPALAWFLKETRGGADVA